MIIDKLMLITAQKTPLQHAFLTISWIVILFAIGYLDWIIPGISFMILYVLLVIIVSLLLGQVDGIASAVSGALFNYLANWKTITEANQYLKILGFILSSLMLIIIEFIVIQLKKLLDREKILSRLDFLTGSFNVRYFREILDKEIRRSSRTGRPFSLAYIDFDDFKFLNDYYGHLAGDELLKSAITIFKNDLRQNDCIGRVGGDEFVILLIETGREALKSIIKRLIKNFQEEMTRRNYKITLSIGYVAFLKMPASVDEALKIADEVMYKAKNGGKNKVETVIFR